MISEILITGGGGLIFSAFSAWAGWFFGRKKYNSEVDGNIIANMEKSLEFYEKLSNDNKTRLDQSLEENKGMKAEIEALTKENKSLKESIDTLTRENQSMREQIAVLQAQMMQLSNSICTDLTCKLRNENFSTLDIHKKEKPNKDEKSKPRKTVRKSTAS